MCKLDKKSGDTRIDPCMKKEIEEFNKSLELLKPYFELENELKIVACCCGHNKYPKTIVLKTRGHKGKVNHPGYAEPMYFEHFSGINIPRVRRFYKKDKQGYYYIPEVLKNESKN